MVISLVVYVYQFMILLYYVYRCLWNCFQRDHHDRKLPFSIIDLTIKILNPLETTRNSIKFAMNNFTFSCD